MSTKERVITAVLIIVFLVSVFGLILAHIAIGADLPSTTNPFFPGMNMPQCPVFHHSVIAPIPGTDRQISDPLIKA